jgi:hypothetical protein
MLQPDFYPEARSDDRLLTRSGPAGDAPSPAEYARDSARRMPTMTLKALLAFRTLSLAALLLAASAPMSGCWMPGYWPGGPQATRGLHTFESTTDFPQVIQLTDIATREVIWSISVPVGQQLVVRFYDDHDPENIDRPALMRWELMDRGTRFGELDNAITVPDYDRRLLEVFNRDGDPAPGTEIRTAR